MSCKHSETEHVLLVVPISAGTGTGFFTTSKLHNGSGVNCSLSLSSKLSPPLKADNHCMSEMRSDCMAGFSNTVHWTRYSKQ